MIDKLKAWWEDTAREILAVAATVTVILAVIFYFVRGATFVVTWTIDFLGISWLIRGWVAGSVAFVLWELAEEIREYKKDPDAYGFWNGEEIPESENETGVE